MFRDLFSSLDYYGGHDLDWMVWLASPIAAVVLLHYSTYWVFANSYQAVVNKLAYGVSRKLNRDSETRVLLSLSGAVMFYISLGLRIGLLRFMGMMPYSFNLLRHVGVCLSISVPLWGVAVLSRLLLRVVQFVGKLVVSGRDWRQGALSVNLEGLRVGLRPFTLGLRLCLNITAGQLLLGFISGLYLNFLFPIYGVGGLVWCAFELVFRLVEFGVLAYQVALILYLSGIYWEEHTLA